MFLFTIYALFLLILSFRNLPLGYSICLLSRFFVLTSVRIGIDDFDMVFYNFITIAYIPILIIHKKNFQQIFTSKFSKYTLLMIILTGIVGIAGGDVPFLSSLKATFFTLLEMIFFFFAWIIFENKEDFKSFYSIFTLIVIVSTIYGLFEYITKDNPYIEYISTEFNDGESVQEKFINEVRGFINGRIEAFTEHPLTHGQYMEIALAFLVLLKDSFYSQSKKLLPYLFILIIVNIIFSGSRAVLIGSLAFITLTIYENISKKFILYSLLLIPLFLYIGGGDKAGTIGSTFKTMIFFWDNKQKEDISGSSVDSRADQYLYMVADLEGKILTGHGLGYIRQEAEAYGGDHPVMHGYESIVLSKVTEVGLLGLIIYLIWYYKICSCISSVLSELGENRTKRYIWYFFATFLICLILTGNMKSSQLFVMMLFSYYKYISVQLDAKQKKSLNNNNIMHSNAT